MKYKLQRDTRDNLFLVLFVLPFLIVFTIFFLYPFFKGVILSFTDWNGISPEYNFIWLKNYVDLFTKDERFINSLLITLIYTFAVVVISNILGIALSLLIEHSGKMKNPLRVGFFLPYVFSLVVVGFSWKLIFTKVFPDLYKLTGWNFFDLDFLGDSQLAVVAVIAVSIWQGLGYYLVIYIAGIQSIDSNILEAADIDGATGWKKFWNVTFPLLMPSVTICVFTSIAGAFKVFDAVFVLTSGGPGYATETIALNIHNEAFGSANLYGYGMAKAVILAIIILIVTFIQLHYFQKKEVQM